MGEMGNYPSVQGLLRALVEQGYWGRRHESIAGAARRFGLNDGGYLGRILRGEAGFQSWTVNILIPHLGPAARAILQAPFLLSGKWKHESTDVVGYDGALTWYAGWADMARAVDWACEQCLNDTQLGHVCWFLIEQLRAGPSSGRQAFDKILSELPRCDHSKGSLHRLSPYTLSGEGRSEAVAEERRLPTLQSLLLLLRKTGVIPRALKAEAFARELGVRDVDYYLEIERGQRDFPEYLINRIIRKLDPIYWIILEAADQYKKNPLELTWPVAEVDGAPDWYFPFVHGLHGLRHYRNVGALPEGSDGFVKEYHRLRMRLHGGITWPHKPLVPSISFISASSTTNG